MTDDVIAEMRNWLSDCQWADMWPEDFDELTDDEVRRGVADVGPDPVVASPRLADEGEVT